MRWLVFLLRYLTGAVLLYACISKAFDSVAGETGLERFASTIAAHGLLPSAWAFSIAVSVVLAEFCVGVGLLLPRPSRVAGWAGLLLLTCFSVYLILVFRHQGKVDCGCLGRLSGNDIGTAIWRNAVLSLGAMLWMCGRREPVSPNAPDLAAPSAAIDEGCGPILPACRKPPLVLPGSRTPIRAWISTRRTRSLSRCRRS